MAPPVQFTTSQLRELDVFRPLSEPALEWLLEAGHLRQLAPNEKLATSTSPQQERYCFLLRGIMAITVSPPSLSQLPKATKASARKRPPKEQKYLGYFDAGSCFSNGFALEATQASTPKVDCEALNAVTLLELDQQHLRELLASQPPWHQQIAQSVSASRSFFLTHQDPSRRQVQDFFLREHYITSSVVRVGRIDLCLDCNKCYDACAERHGTPRMARLGLTLGRLTFPVVCRTCDDHPCVPVCKPKAIAFSDLTSEIQISDDCLGCGLCAKHCPNDAISMIPLPQSDPSVKGPKKRAVKCDHCADYGDRACLTACPTGALIEIEPNELFKEAFPPPNSLYPSFSETSFLKGLPETTPRQKRIDSLKNWGTVVTMLVLTWLGIESFLIRTQPEHSLLSRVVHATGSSFAVSYTSGRGIGHWFGYIGTTLMLASIVYTLRTRLSRFKNWGSQKGWLSAHLWLGFVGATLVTYHAAFKLDRWASIACYLMWFVIVTGAVGRYAFGWVHSAVNQAEFELNSLRGRCAHYAENCATPGAVAALIGPDPAEGRKRWTVTVMFWEELRDRLALLWVRALGTRHLNTRKERREMVRCFADWAEQRRRISYCESAKPILRHWNIVHIVLAVLMFILAGFHVVYGFLYKAV